MSIRRGLILVWMLAGLQVLAVGQDQPRRTRRPRASGDDSAQTRLRLPHSRPIAGMQTEGGTG